MQLQRIYEETLNTGVKYGFISGSQLHHRASKAKQYYRNKRASDEINPKQFMSHRPSARS